MEKQRYKELGDFLKNRRSRISPSQVGFQKGLKRRTLGLRREEVASLAGIGLTWYTWLEQGRDIKVSSSVLESLSRVLLLDKQEVIHLYTLAGQVPPTEVPLGDVIISPILQNVLDNLLLSPAFIMDTRWNIISWNKAATVVFGDFNKINKCERNMVWMMFNNDDYKSLFIDWEFHAKGMLARFCSTTAKYMEDPWLIEFIKNLKKINFQFNLWWSNYEVQTQSGFHKKLKHPIAGTMVFEFVSFDVSDSPNLKLIINNPLSGTDTDIKVKLLMKKLSV